MQQIDFLCSGDEDKRDFVQKKLGSHQSIIRGILKSGGWPSGQSGGLPDRLSWKAQVRFFVTT